MSDANTTVGPKPQPKPASKGCIVAFVLGFFLLCCICVGPRTPPVRHPWHNVAMQQARQIGQCLFLYATDHNGIYPDGKSSTEVFQKLIDGGYATDPEIFYLSLTGKVKAVAGQKLKPENVSWDVTSGVDSHSSDLVPVVFMTGYKMTYEVGGSAVPVIKPYPQFWSRTWSQWWNDTAPPPVSASPGMALFYKGNNAVFIRSNPDNSVPNVVYPGSIDSKIILGPGTMTLGTKSSVQGQNIGAADGHTYRQLTPDGVLPP